VKYVSLHHHSTYSYMDGFGTPAQHVARATELNMRYLALTDHGNVSGHVGLEKAAAKAGITPIFGLEAYTEIEPRSSRKFHLTLLAMDEAGYQNLNRIVTESWQEFFRWPTVSGEILARHHEGIIVLSGCSDSLLACSLLGGKGIAPEDASPARAVELAWRMKDLLGDRFYLECQLFPELDRTKVINQFYEEMGLEIGIQLVATSDVHTLREGDHVIRATLHAAGRGSNTIAQQMSGWEYEVPDYIPLSDSWVYDRAIGTGLSPRAAKEACRNTYEIAQRCNVTLPKAPRFRYPTEGAVKRW
jgi:DNA polymerase-3 subunit alpha